jgi:hypothetical protein
MEVYWIAKQRKHNKFLFLIGVDIMSVGGVRVGYTLLPLINNLISPLLLFCY